MIRIVIEKVRRYWTAGYIDVFSANVINKIVAMLSNMVITRILSKSDYGVWSYILNVYSYLALLSGLGILSGAFQFGAENRGVDKEYKYYKYCAVAGFVVDCGLLLLFTVGTLVFGVSFPSAGNMLRAYFPVVLLEFVFNLMITIFRCENRIKDYAKALNFNTLIIASGTCLGAVRGIAGIIVCKYIAYVISISYVLLKSKSEIVKIRNSDYIQTDDIKELWHYSIFTGISSMLNGLLYLIDVSMVARLIFNETDVANYKVATLIPNALNFIPASVILVVLPSFIYRKNDIKWVRSWIKKIFIMMGIGNLLLCGSLIIFSREIIIFISGRQYVDAIPMFRILIIEYFFSGTFRFLSCNFLAAYKRVNYGLFISVLSVICDVAFNYHFITRCGTIGAAYGTFGSVLISAVFAFSYFMYGVKSNSFVGDIDE